MRGARRGGSISRPRPLSLSLSPRHILPSTSSPPASRTHLQADHRAALLDGLHGVLDLGKRGGERGKRRGMGVRGACVFQWGAPHAGCCCLSPAPPPPPPAAPAPYLVDAALWAPGDDVRVILCEKESTGSEGCVRERKTREGTARRSMGGGSARGPFARAPPRPRHHRAGGRGEG